MAQSLSNVNISSGSATLSGQTATFFPGVLQLDGRLTPTLSVQQQLVLASSRTALIRIRFTNTDAQDAPVSMSFGSGALLQAGGAFAYATSERRLELASPLARAKCELLFSPDDSPKVEISADKRRYTAQFQPLTVPGNDAWTVYFTISVVFNDTEWEKEQPEIDRMFFRPDSLFDSNEDRW